MAKRVLSRGLSEAASALLLFTLAACGTEARGGDGAGKFSEPLAQPPDDAWPMFRADPARTGKSKRAQTGRKVAEELWRVSPFNTTDYGAAKGSPAVVGDVVYIGTDTGKLRAFHRDDGRELWEVEIDGTTQGIHGTPAIVGDLLYVGAYNGTLYAFDLDGTQQWATKRGFQIGSSPVVVPEHGRVYSAHERDESGGGWVLSVDARTGEVIWEFPIGAHAHSSVAVDVARGRLFVGDNAAIMRALDAASGELVWAVDLDAGEGDDPADIKTTPVYVARHNLVVAGAWSRKVHAFDGDTGEIVWEVETDRGLVMGSAAYAPERDVIYVGALSPASALYAIEAGTGELVWKHAVGSGVKSSPAINADESLVVFGANDGNLYAVDAETGEEVFRHAIGGQVTSSPALMDDMVYVAAQEGDLVAVRTE